MGFWSHIRPKRLHQGQVRFSATLGLGGLLVLLHVVLFFSGVLLMFYYVPTEGGAYSSVKLIHNAVPFGWFFRNIHRLSADIVIVVTVLHTSRVFYTGAYQGRRAFNWFVGIALFLLTFLLAYTGYLLTWDQTGYWAIVVVSGIVREVPKVGELLHHIFLAGDAVSGDTLLRFYTLHCIAVPSVLFTLVAVHLYHVRHAGGVAVKDKGGKVDVVELYKKEVVFASFALSALGVLSAFLDAPLGPPADPSRTPNPAKAPWYFCGVQFMLKHTTPFVGGVVIPLLSIALLSVSPFLSKGGEGVWFSRERYVSCIIYTAFLLFAVSATLLGVIK